MKYFLSSVLCVLFFFNGKCQYTRFIVQLKNKANSVYSFANPAPYLSPKAIQRRARFNISIDSADLPVNQRYIDSIQAVPNVTVLSVSKWLNSVLIKTSDATAISKIQSFSFVTSAVNTAPRLAAPSTPHFTERIEPLKPLQAKNQQVLSDAFSYGNNYNQVHIHEGEFLHNKGFTGGGMQITVLDAGFSQFKTVTAFDSIRLNNQVLGERDFVDFDNSVNEDDSHGMYCLSTMAANWPGQMIGTSPKANYWLVRTENAPNEYPVEEHNWVVGAEFADSTGSDMISSSLGYNTFDDASFDHTYSEFYKNRTRVTQGATLAAKKGLIVMNSAGNEGGNSWKYIVFPADADSVCTVGAVNSQGAIANFSSRGYAGKVKPNIVSVGVSTVIAGFNNLPSSGNGTSFANPNVAGLIACLWQAFPGVNNMKILDAVYRSGSHYTTPDSAYGFGIPNFRIAYRLLKHDQNVALYGTEWLWANPDPFDSLINVKVIGRKDGNAVLYLKNATGVIVKKMIFATEPEEVYNFRFDTLSALPAGYYTVQFDDSTTTRSITLHKGTIFPLKLLSFTGTILNNQAQLQWVTEDENSVKNYGLLRSADGNNFMKVADVSPLYGAAQNRYTFTDPNTLPEAYYKLTTTGFDGSSTVSNTVFLKLTNSQLSLQYDVQTAAVRVVSVRPVADKLQLIIYSADGKKIRQYSRVMTAGVNQLNFSLMDLPGAIYVLNAETGAGKKSLKVKR